MVKALQLQCQNRLQKNNDETLLKYIGNELLPIWDTCRCRSYTFKIYYMFKTDGVDFYFSPAENTIEKILQFGPISDCSSVFFDLHQYTRQLFVNVKLPCEAIANWLIRGHNYDAINLIGQNHKEKKEKERILEIMTNSFFSYNSIQIMINLKKVN